MKIFYWSYAIGIISLFLSCTKPEMQKALEGQPFKSGIKSCDCIQSKDNNYRIEATIHGEKLCFDRKQRPVQPDTWTVSSWQNSIRAERYNIDSTLKIRIHYKNPNFQQKSLPYKIDSSNVQFCETFLIELMNLKPNNFCEGCTSDDSYYTSLSSTSNLSVSILSFNETVIEGTFEGDFQNRSPAKFKVTNGYFRLNLEK